MNDFELFHEEWTGLPAIIGIIHDGHHYEAATDTGAFYIDGVEMPEIYDPILDYCFDAERSVWRRSPGVITIEVTVTPEQAAELARLWRTDEPPSP